MITVRVDSHDLPADIGSLKTMGDLIELVKASIDPEVIITSLNIGGKPLSEQDWQMPLSVHRDTILEITTGDKGAYVTERLGQSEEHLTHIIAEFEQSSSHFRSSEADNGNRLFATAVDDLLAFLNWYVSLLALEGNAREAQLTQFQAQLGAIKDTCDQLVQQQMYHSWWALGETLQSKLLPLLLQMKEFCRMNKQ